MTADEIQSKCDEIAQLLRERLGLQGRNIAVTTAKARRDVPAKLRTQAAFLVEQAQLAQSPKLARMLDAQAIDRAHADLVTHLETINRAERRKSAILRWLGTVSFGLIVVFVALITVLVWRGFL